MGVFVRGAAAQTALSSIFFGMYLFWLMFSRISLSVVFPNASQISLWGPVASICVLAFFVYGFIPQINSMIQSKLHVLFGVVLAGATLITCLPIFHQQPLISYIIVVLIGISLPWFLVSWMSLLARFSVIRIVVSFVVGGLIAAGLFVVITGMSTFAACLVALLSIMASAVFLSTRDTETHPSEKRAEIQHTFLSSTRSVGGLALMAIFVLGFITQLLSLVSLVPINDRDGMAEGDAAIACFAVSVILFLGLVAYRFKKTNRYAYMEASLTFSLILIAMTTLLSSWLGGDSVFSVVFSICTRLSFLVVLIVLLISVSHGSSEPRPTLCLGLATLYFGYSIGGLLGEIQLTSKDVTTTAMLALSLLLVSALFILIRRIGASKNCDSISHSQMIPNGSGSVNYLQFAEDQGLTPRQTEVLGCLAAGRSNAYISKVLDISENTAKAHVSKIYEKLGVHCRDELLDRLEHYVTNESLK